MARRTSKDKLATQNPRTNTRKRDMKKTLRDRFQSWNQQLTNYSQTPQGQSYFISLFLSALFIGWGLMFMNCYVFLQTGPVHSQNYLLSLPIIFGLYLLLAVSNSFIRRLYWRPEEELSQTPIQNTPEEKEKKRLQAQQEKYQEFRALGDRIIVDGVPFKYGESRRHFERAPWYRN